MADAVVGIVANPLSGRDIRRLVAKASVFPTSEKANMVQRIATACAAAGVDRVLLNTDLGGISAAVLRALKTRRPGDPAWPDLEFVETERITQTADDTRDAVTRMRAAGARVIVCLGGDGTARVAAAACGDTPLLALSTGTNNAFPRMREATVAGLAAGLVASAAVGTASPVTRRVPVLEVTAAGRTEIALVDVAVSTAGHVGSRAVWDPTAIIELYCAFAEPDGIGLSSVAGLLCPSPRTDPDGVALRLGGPDDDPHRDAESDPSRDATGDAEGGRRGRATVVRAPIAPGLVADVRVRDWRTLRSGATVTVAAERGVIAVDGEREIEFRATGPDGTGRPYVRLRPDGPRCVDVPAVLAAAAARGLLTNTGRKA